MMNRGHDSPRTLDVFSERASSLGIDASPACVALVVGPRAIELLDELTSDATFRQHCELEHSAAIVWAVEPEPDADADAVDLASAGMQELDDDTLLVPGGRYFVPAHRRLWFEGTVPRQAPRTPSDHHPIDRLLMSVAEGWGKQSAVLLSLPEGEDGECGLRIIRAVGGLGLQWPAAARPRLLSRHTVIRQRRVTVRHTAASEAGEASEAGAPPAVSSPRRVEPSPSEGAPSVPPSGVSPRVGALLRPRVFSLPAHARAVARAACAAAMHRARHRGRLRVWLPECKTGGLTYTLAMLLSEAASEVQPQLKVLIYGTDDDEEALSVARAGRYPVGTALGMDPELRARYTFDEGDTIRVSEALRGVCLFARHELTRDLPMARMDLVVCHRVFEGLSAARRAQLVESFHYSLRDGGLLLALDHVDAFPDERFERVEPGYLRARPPRPERHVSFPPRVVRPPSSASHAPFATREAFGAEPFERSLHAAGLPLISCDGALRVFYLSVEAQVAFGLSADYRGSRLEELSPRLPGGFELVTAARRVAETALTQELTVRMGASTYLVRITAEGAGGAISLPFMDVTELDAARAHALGQSERHAALSQLGARALTPIDPSGLSEEALGVLFDHVPACSAAVIATLGGKPGEYDAMASRGLGVDPLRTLRGVGDAVALLDAAAQRGCIVSQGGARAAWDERGAPSRRRGPRWGVARPLDHLTRSLACPISASGEVLGVIALYGRSARIDEPEHQRFVQAVAHVLGATWLRQRTQRRLELELAVGRELAAGTDLSQAAERILPPLAAALGVEELEIWMARDAARRRWMRLFPSVQAESPTPTWSPDIALAPFSEVALGSLTSDVRELLVPVRARHLPPSVLCLRGKNLRPLDRQLSEGLSCIARLLGDFLERLQSLEHALQSQAAYRQKSAELEALYASLPVGVSIHDQSGAIRHANRHLAALRASPGTPGAEPLRRLYAEAIPSWVERVMKTGEPCHDVELCVSDAGGQLGAWLCNFAPIRGADGTLHGVSVVVQDIRALKLVEATLREADQQKDDFLAMLGHELRNPVAALRNATELLGRVDQPSPQLMRLQSIFDRQTLQTTKLIEGLLDVARVARGKVELSLGPVQLTELVRQVLEDRRQQFADRELDLRLPEAELWVSADRVRLVQILDNLISNALKFTLAGGHIRVEANGSGERGFIVVEDDGVGIDAELLPQIFEPFRQGRSHASSPGLGLGLALVHGLAELHGFPLSANSSGPGRGASFRIDFPLVAAPESDAPPSRVDLRTLDLLLVEDNPDIAETLGELLSASGHRVEVVGSAEGALAALRVRRPDIVLCDIGLPGMDGIELATRLRADPELRTLKLVAMTGYGDAASRSRIESAGFDRQLIKPVHMDALRHCLSRLAAQLEQPSERRG